MNNQTDNFSSFTSAITSRVMSCRRKRDEASECTKQKADSFDCPFSQAFRRNNSILGSYFSHFSIIGKTWQTFYIGKHFVVQNEYKLTKLCIGGILRTFLRILSRNGLVLVLHLNVFVHDNTLKCQNISVQIWYSISTTW